MVYPVKNSAGATLATIADSTLNNSATSLTLIGKNYAGYGNFLNENFVYLLENFAKDISPANPLTGQLWYDSINKVLKLYNGTVWKPISSSAASPTPPTNPVVGDLWWDTSNLQLKVWSGTIWVLIGPTYTAGAGISGAIVQTILDISGSSHLCILFYISNLVYSIISKDAAFSPQTAINGFSTIYPGYNLIAASALPGSQFTGDATNALALNGVTSAQFLRSDQNSATSYQLTAGGGLVVGSDLSILGSTPTNELALRTIQINRNLNFYVNQNGANTAAISVQGSTSSVTFANAVVVNGTFTSNSTISALSGINISGAAVLQNTLLPNSAGVVGIGASSTPFANVFAGTFYGNIVGNVTANAITVSGNVVATQAYVQTTGYNSQGFKTVQPVTSGVPSNGVGNNGDIIYQY
jgi:hypothetical protein